MISLIFCQLKHKMRNFETYFAKRNEICDKIQGEMPFITPIAPAKGGDQGNSFLGATIALRRLSLVNIFLK